MASLMRFRRRPARRGRRPTVALNLATEPLGGYRAFSTLACVAALAILSITCGLAWHISSMSGAPREYVSRQRDLAEERRSLATLTGDARDKIGGSQADRIREQTSLLNGLLIRKGVSWTRTFLDLEGVLPPSVRMLTIRPEVAGEDTLRLDMTVSAKTPDDFIAFLRALEGSDVFQFPALRGSAPPAEDDPTFRYRLTVDYDQQL